MKARASNLMIGSMTLAVIAAAFVGLLGYRKIHGIAQQAPLSKAPPAVCAKAAT
jgi:phospholipid/cholesterol/gamma-HCH transport system substrate-binding protein